MRPCHSPNQQKLFNKSNIMYVQRHYSPLLKKISKKYKTLSNIIQHKKYLTFHDKIIIRTAKFTHEAHLFSMKHIFRSEYSFLTVSATRRRRAIKLPLCLWVPVWKSLIQQVTKTTMDARRKAMFPFPTGDTLFGEIWPKKSKLSL